MRSGLTGSVRAQSKLGELEKKRKEATSDQKEKNTTRAKLEADVSDLEEQIRKHERTQVTIPSVNLPCIVWIIHYTLYC